MVVGITLSCDRIRDALNMNIAVIVIKIHPTLYIPSVQCSFVWLVCTIYTGIGLTLRTRDGSETYLPHLLLYSPCTFHKKGLSNNTRILSTLTRFHYPALSLSLSLSLARSHARSSIFYLLFIVVLFCFVAERYHVRDLDVPFVIELFLYGKIAM